MYPYNGMFLYLLVLLRNCCNAHFPVVTFPHRRAKMKGLRKRRSRQRMGRKKKKEEENKKGSGRPTKRIQRWVCTCISVTQEIKCS